MAESEYLASLVHYTLTFQVCRRGGLPYGGVGVPGKFGGGESSS